MARNEEKANSMLSRFLKAKKEEEGKGKVKERRPFLATECRDLSEADKWRHQILREIGRKVMEIQNKGLDESRLRDLNDEINKLIREKGHWETRIVELGGPDHSKDAPKIQDEEGNDLDVASGKGAGYRYFGAAKQLPGVRELFEKPALPKKRRNRHEMFKRIDAAYYGFRDDEDGVLERLERDAERANIMKAVGEWQRIAAVKAEAMKGVQDVVRVTSRAEEAVDDDVDVVAARMDDSKEDDADMDGPQGRLFVAHVPLPDEKEIERMVLQKKKAELLSKYATEELLAEEQEAKSLLNVKR